VSISRHFVEGKLAAVNLLCNSFRPSAFLGDMQVGRDFYASADEDISMGISAGRVGFLRWLTLISVVSYVNLTTGRRADINGSCFSMNTAVDTELV